MPLSGSSNTRATRTRPVPESAIADGAADPPSQRAQRSSVSATEGIYLSATGVMAANLLTAPAPVYPVMASEAGVQGKVVVQARVGRDGRVVEVQVLSGDPMLREAALNAVRGWRYRPYLADGQAAEVETLATLDFRLFQREQ